MKKQYLFLALAGLLVCHASTNELQAGETTGLVRSSAAKGQSQRFLSGGRADDLLVRFFNQRAAGSELISRLLGEHDRNATPGANDLLANPGDGRDVAANSAGTDAHNNAAATALDNLVDALIADAFVLPDGDSQSAVEISVVSIPGSSVTPRDRSASDRWSGFGGGTLAGPSQPLVILDWKIPEPNTNGGVGGIGGPTGNFPTPTVSEAAVIAANNGNNGNSGSANTGSNGSTNIGSGPDDNNTQLVAMIFGPPTLPGNSPASPGDSAPVNPTNATEPGDTCHITDFPQTPVVPEPSSLILFGIGAAGIAALRKRKTSAA